MTSPPPSGAPVHAGEREIPLGREVEQSLAVMIVRLVRRMRKVKPDDDLAATALDYVQRLGLPFSPLRASTAHPPQPATGEADALEAAISYCDSMGLALEFEQVEGIVNAALAAHPPHGEGQWLPIESAPSDVELLLYTPHLHESNPERVEARVYHDTRAGSRHAWATHWMPLPAAPGASPARVEGSDES